MPQWKDSILLGTAKGIGGQPKVKGSHCPHSSQQWSKSLDGEKGTSGKREESHNLLYSLRRHPAEACRLSTLLFQTGWSFSPEDEEKPPASGGLLVAQCPPHLGGGGQSPPTWLPALHAHPLLPKLSDGTLPAWGGQKTTTNQQQKRVPGWESDTSVCPHPYSHPTARRQGSETWRSHSDPVLTMPRKPRAWPQRDHFWRWGCIRMMVSERGKSQWFWWPRSCALWWFFLKGNGLSVFPKEPQRTLKILKSKYRSF